jgi:biopolymer transport protein ExbB/TolQ
MLGGPEKAEALKSAKRAAARSAAVVHGELKRGLNSLATVASTAPWVGLFGTVVGFHTSFGAVSGSKESIMAYIFDGLSRAFVPCAVGIIVALVAMWCYKYLLTEVEAFDSEMENASLQLISDLGRLESN